MTSKNAKYQAKHRQKLISNGYVIKNIALSEKSIDKINKLKDSKGISFNDAINELLSK